MKNSSLTNLTSRWIMIPALLACIVGLAISTGMHAKNVLAHGGNVSGAIFTTTVNGDVVNGNTKYESKYDVYLDGGPGPNAPKTAAGLDDGVYYFMVTDPSGKTLLSLDSKECRRVIVSGGVITGVVEHDEWKKVKGQWQWVPCEHNMGDDIDHNAKTVQLMPYKNTPNKGGVYKAWMTPVADYDESAQGNVHGFIHHHSKTDNYKIKNIPAPEITWRKFNDLNANGMIDEGEPEIGLNQWIDVNGDIVPEEPNGGGWPVYVTDTLNVETKVYTPATTLAPIPGDYTGQEETKYSNPDFDQWFATGVIIDGEHFKDPNIYDLTSAVVTVLGERDETHEVIFLNAEKGKITICKVYDANGNGERDNDEELIEGFKFIVTGTDYLGRAYNQAMEPVYSGPDGCLDIDLLPGHYRVTEILPNSNWYNSSGQLWQDVEVESGECEEVLFTNYCITEVTQHTKGFWQGPNGCDAIATNPDGYLGYLNTLAPYIIGAYATNGQDNCNGVSCPSTTYLPFDNSGELGCFIVAPNSQDPKLQLAQQLAAFTLSNMHFGDLDNVITLPGEDPFVVRDLIELAAAIWATGTQSEINAMASLLDGYNNAGTLPVISADPCEFAPY